MDTTGAKSSQYDLRNFYQRWTELMDVRTWGALATWGNGQRENLFCPPVIGQP